MDKPAKEAFLRGTASKIIVGVVTSLILMAIGAHVRWLFSVEKRFNDWTVVEQLTKRIENLEEKLSPMIIEWGVQKRLMDMGHIDHTIMTTSPAETRARVAAVEEVDNWRTEQRAIIDPSILRKIDKSDK